MKEDTKTLLGIGAAVVGAFLFLRSNGSSGGGNGPTSDIPVVGSGVFGGGPWIPGFLDGNDGGIGPDIYPGDGPLFGGGPWISGFLDGNDGGIGPDIIPGDGPILGGGPLLGGSGPAGIQLPDLGTGGGLTGNPNTNIRDKLPF